jgi:chemosensory pili system protein ChpA (sensor histidine kinase/response regulator)
VYYQEGGPDFEYAGQQYKLRYMGNLLDAGRVAHLEGQLESRPVLLIRNAEPPTAIQVDSLLGSREVVVKTLGPQFAAVPGLSGATVLGDGSVVVILDMLASIRADVARRLAGNQAPAQTAIARKNSRLVMVVDDSVTVRKVTSRLLARQHMEVLLARDGVDAVSQLQDSERLPDVILLDIEMPRMDGFEVASRVRSNPRMKDIPIIMISSRTGQKHRQRAFGLGVHNFLGKPYQEIQLLKAIDEVTSGLVDA